MFLDLKMYIFKINPLLVFTLMLGHKEVWEYRQLFSIFVPKSWVLNFENLPFILELILPKGLTFFVNQPLSIVRMNMGDYAKRLGGVPRGLNNNGWKAQIPID